MTHTESFDPIKAMSEIDISWVLENGWTVASNLAYRHLLSEHNANGEINLERVEQVAMRYEAQEQLGKIKESLQEIISLKKQIAQI
jgi:hypothetical protein